MRLGGCWSLNTRSSPSSRRSPAAAAVTCWRNRDTRCRSRGWGSPCGSRRRRAGERRWCSFRNLDEHFVPLERHRVCGGGNDGWEACHLSRDQIEEQAVLRAFDVHVPELAVTERELFVGARVVQRVEVAIFGVRKAHGRATSLHFLE